MKMGGAGKTMRRSFQSGKSERGYANATQNACAVSSGCSTETSLTVPAKPIPATILDRKSTRLNSSHSQTSYAVFCLKKKNNDVLIAPLYRSGRGPTVSPPWRWTPAVRQLPACCRVLRVVRLLSELPSHADPPAHPPS